MARTYRKRGVMLCEYYETKHGTSYENLRFGKPCKNIINKRKTKPIRIKGSPNETGHWSWSRPVRLCADCKKALKEHLEGVPVRGDLLNDPKEERKQFNQAKLDVIGEIETIILYADIYDEYNYKLIRPNRLKKKLQELKDRLK